MILYDIISNNISCQYDCLNAVTGILAQETQLLHGEKSPHGQRSKDGMDWNGLGWIGMDWYGLGWIKRGKSHFSDQNVGFRSNPII